MQGPRGCLCPGSEPAGLSDRFDFGGCLTSFRHPFFIRTAIRELFRIRCAQRVKDVSGNPCACVCGGGYPVSCRRLFVRPGAGRLERRPDRSNGGSGGEPAEPCGGLRNDVRRLSEVAVRDAGSGCGASVSGRHGRIEERKQPCLGGRTTEPDAGRERIAGQRTTWDIVEPAVGLSDRESIGAGPRRRTPESDGSGGEAAEPQCAFMPRGISPLLRAACRPCCGWK